jgi:hypothetical protein
MPEPARITIELERPRSRHGRWVTRTVSVDRMTQLVPSEPREPDVMPAAYEPGECTCHDGWCDRDHANE